MLFTSRLTLAALFACIVALTPQGARGGPGSPRGGIAPQPFTWERKVSVPPAPFEGFDDGFDAAFDPQGNVFVVGYGEDEEFAITGTVAKFAPDGTFLWKSHVPGELFEVETDAQGNAYAVGDLPLTPEGGDLGDFGVVKFSPDGALLWQRGIDGSNNRLDLASALAVAADGGVVVGGRVSGVNTGNDFTVARWSADGTFLWSRVLVTSDSDIARDVVIDSAGNVIAAGQLGRGSDRDFTVVKWDGDGTELWRRLLTGNGTINNNDSAAGVAVDSQDNVVAAGDTFNVTTGRDWTVAKWAPDGTQLWRRDLSGTQTGGTFGSFDLTGGVVIDSQDRVVVGGFLDMLATGNDIAAVRWLPDGTQDWVRTYDRLGPGRDQGNQVAVTPTDQVVVSGVTDAPNGDDFTAVIWNEAGELETVRFVDGTSSNSGEVGRGIAVDPRGNIAVGGYSVNDITYFDTTLALLDRENPRVLQPILPGAPLPAKGASTEVGAELADNVGILNATVTVTGPRVAGEVLALQRGSGRRWTGSFAAPANPDTSPAVYNVTLSAVDREGNPVEAVVGTLSVSPSGLRTGRLEVSPGQVAFGRIGVGRYGEQVVRVQNVGDAPVEGTIGQLDAPFQFRLPKGSPLGNVRGFFLEPGQTINVRVLFVPRRRGVAREVLRVTGGAVTPRPVRLSGTGC